MILIQLSVNDDIKIALSAGVTATVRKGHVIEKIKNQNAVAEIARKNPNQAIRRRVEPLIRILGPSEEEIKEECGKTPINVLFRFFTLYFINILN